MFNHGKPDFTGGLLFGDRKLMDVDGNCGFTPRIINLENCLSYIIFHKYIPNLRQCDLVVLISKFEKKGGWAFRLFLLLSNQRMNRIPFGSIHCFMLNHSDFRVPSMLAG